MDEGRPRSAPQNGVGDVTVLYGSGTGLTGQGSQLWDQDSPGVPDTAEASDLFGEALAAGDFDHDGFADLAVGVLSEDLGITNEAGAGNVLYGSPAGLSSARSQVWHQDVPGVEDSIVSQDAFGGALVTG
ncbi:MAG: FG-GAP repeat protein [Gemmatimonadetes bacterium]|nr:FG-GAP repeat protein [Gemmatimonadota bacterium]